MRVILTLTFVVMFISSSFAQESVYFKGSFDQAQEKAKIEGKLILLNLTSKNT